MPQPAVPFYDLKQEYSLLKKEVSAAIERVLQTQRFVLGEELTNRVK